MVGIAIIEYSEEKRERQMTATVVGSSKLIFFCCLLALMDKAVKPCRPKYSIGVKTPRPEPWQRFTPGPGAYRSLQGIGEPSPMLRSAIAAKFGWSGRPGGPEKNSQAGGPGTYILPSQLGTQPLSTRKSAPRPTIQARTPRREREVIDTLGSGSVLPRFVDRKTAPKFSLGLRRDRRSQATPGPGSHYSETYDANKLRAPAYTISGRNDHTIIRGGADGGGPAGRCCREDSALGRQKVSDRRNYPAYSFGLRKVEVYKHASPGPGTYG